MLPENEHYPGPYDSEEMLFGAINGTPEGLELKDLEEIVDKENLEFYLDESLLSTLVEGMNADRIIYDDEAHRFKPGLLVADGDRSQNQP
jgi:hypothetical protein